MVTMPVVPRKRLSPHLVKLGGLLRDQVVSCCWFILSGAKMPSELLGNLRFQAPPLSDITKVGS